MAEQVRPRGLPGDRDDDGEHGEYDEPGERDVHRKPKRLQRRAHMARKQPRRRKLRPDRLAGEAEFQAMRLACFRRAGWRCERCGERKPLQAHHRQLLSQGGPDALSNLAALDADCHSWAHAHPRAAQLGGWIVPSWADPASRAMLLYDGRLVVPDDEGGYRFASPPAA